MMKFITHKQVHQLTAVNSPRAAVKPTITRVAKNATAAKTSTPEQKIAALTRQGNLKITRKVVNAPINPNTQPISVHGGEEFSLTESYATTVAPADDQQQVPMVATQIIGQVDASGHQSVALIDASHLEQSVNEIKKEGGDIVMNADQIHQLQQAGGIVTDQEGYQQILATSEDGGQQLIQFVTGEDGTLYQVAGKNEQGQTILIAQGADGEQQCVYVAAEGEGIDLDDANNGGLSIDGNLVDAHAEIQQQLQQQLVAEGQGQSIQFALGTDEAATVQGVHEPLAVATDDGDSQDGQITAEVVQADLPSPGRPVFSVDSIQNRFASFHTVLFPFFFSLFTFHAFRRNETGDFTATRRKFHDHRSG